MNEYLEFIKLNKLMGTAEIISAIIIGFFCMKTSSSFLFMIIL
jgi:hypothetical protein